MAKKISSTIKDSLKVRIQRLDKKGQLIINKKIRQEVGMTDDCYVYLSPRGKGKILLSVIGDANDLISLIEKAVSLQGEAETTQQPSTEPWA